MSNKIFPTLAIFQPHIIVTNIQFVLISYYYSDGPCSYCAGSAILDTAMSLTDGDLAE